MGNQAKLRRTLMV